MSRKLIELLIDEDSHAFGVEAISLVREPAIQVNWVAFNKQGNQNKMIHLAQMDEEQRTLIAPALIPDLKIVRYDEAADEEYDVYFSQDTVKLASELFLKNNRANAHTFEHAEPVEGVSVVESWIIQDPSVDKAKLYGFTDLPKGTWMVRAKVDNPEIWEKIKAGEAKGLSIEGYFLDKVEKMQAAKKPKKKGMLEAIFDAVVLNKKNFYAEATLTNGKSVVTEHEKLTVGAPVYTLDEDGQPIELSNGSYTTEGGIDLEVYDGVLLEYDGEAQAVEDSEVPAEDPVTELDAMKVDFYKALLKTRYSKKFGKGAKNVTLSEMKQTALSAKRDAQNLVDDSFDTWGETGEALSYAIGDVALEVFPELDSQVYDCMMDAARAAEKGDVDATRDHLAKAYDYADRAVQTYIDVLLTAVGTLEQYS